MSDSMDYRDRRDGIERNKQDRKAKKLAEKQARSQARREKHSWLERRDAA